MTDGREEAPDGADLIIPSWLASVSLEEREAFWKDLGTDLGMDSQQARPFSEREFNGLVIMVSTAMARQSGLEFSSMEDFATTYRTLLRLFNTVFLRRPGLSGKPSKRKDFTRGPDAAKRLYWSRFQRLREAIGWTTQEYDKDKVDFTVSYNSGLASAFVDVKTLEELATWEENIIGLPKRFYSATNPWSQSFVRTIKDIAPSTNQLTREAALELVWQFGRGSGTVLSNMMKGYFELGRKAVGMPVDPPEIARAAHLLLEKGRALLNSSDQDFRDALSPRLESRLSEIKAEQERLEGIHRSIASVLARLDAAGHSVQSLVYQSPAWRKTFTDILAVAPDDATVLLTGETGCGKRVLAHMIHALSPRRRGAYHYLDFDLDPGELAESKLFGLDASIGTGASAETNGLAKEAHGGTLLLTSIEAASKSVQAKLLDWVDTGYLPGRGNEKVDLDVRLIATTSKDLKKEVEEGRFREDLYFLLDVIPISVPPFRDRREDLPYLITDMVLELAQTQKRPSTPIVSKSAMKMLLDYDWPGNFRELKTVLQRALVRSKWTSVEEEHIKFSAPRRRAVRNDPPESTVKPTERESGDMGEESDPAIIAKLLKAAGDNKVRNPSLQDRIALYDECRVNRNWSNAKIGRELGVHRTTVLGWFTTSDFLPHKSRLDSLRDPSLESTT